VLNVTHLRSDIINSPESELRTHGMIFPMIYYIKQQDIEVKMRKPRIFIKTVTLISISSFLKFRSSFQERNSGFLLE